MNEQAVALNKIIEAESPSTLRLLSQKGKEAFFPRLGIMGQTADAKGKRFNATIGIALEDDGSPMRMSCLADQMPVEPKDAFPYAPSYGKPELRAKWQKMICEKNPSLNGKISLPVVTCALTHGLSMTAMMLLNPGDELIVSDKFWGNYKLMFAQPYGANITTYNTFTETGFDTAAFREKMEERVGKKVVLLNFPNNPSGYCVTNAEAEEIIAILVERANAGIEIAVIVDDAYFGQGYESDVYPESLFAKLAHAHENILAIKVDGASKEDYAWGMRVGFVTFGSKNLTNEGYNALADKIAGCVRGSVSNIAHPCQSMLLKIYDDPQYHAQKQEKIALMQSRYKKVRDVLSDPKYEEYFTPLPFNAGYFMCVQLADGIEGEEVRQKLLEDYDTGIIAVGNLLRIAYSCLAEEDIQTVFENIYNACSDLTSSLYPSPS